MKKNINPGINDYYDKDRNRSHPARRVTGGDWFDKVVNG